MTIFTKEKASSIVHYAFGAEEECGWWEPEKMSRKLLAVCFLDNLFKQHTFMTYKDLMWELRNIVKE